MLKKLARIFLTLSLALFAFMLSGCGSEDNQQSKPDASNNANKLVLYTSMKESRVGGILDGFKAKYPGVEIDYQSAGAGKIMAKLDAERQSGHIMADVIWTSEVPDFYQMKEEGLLEQYTPGVFNEILNPFDD